MRFVIVVEELFGSRKLEDERRKNKLLSAALESIQRVGRLDGLFFFGQVFLQNDGPGVLF